MVSKNVSTQCIAGKKKMLIMVELKKKNIDKHENACCGYNLSMQSKHIDNLHIMNRKDEIKGRYNSKRLSKQRTSVYEEMEKLILLSIYEKQLAGLHERCIGIS